jgi:surface glycoprotein (TIGR04207 family)
MTNTGNKIRAVFLAAIMVTSVFGMGVAFTGSAAAQTAGGGDIGLEEGVNQNVSIGSQPAEINRITVNDSGGSVFSDQTVFEIASDSGVTWESVDDVQYAGSFVDFSISDDGQTLTVQHPDTSSTGDRIRIINPKLNVESDANAGDVSVTIDYAIGSATVSDFFSASKPLLDGPTQDLSLGATDQSFSGRTLNVSTQSDSGEIGSEVILTAAPDDGFSWNTTNISDNDILNSSSGLGANVSEATFTASEIRIPIDSGPSAATGTNVSFNTENLTVDVSGDAVNTTFGAAVIAANGSQDVELAETYAVNGTAETDVALSGNPTVAIGANNQSLDGSDVEINVTDAGTDNIGEGTNVTVSTNSEYVSFNQTNVNTSNLTENDATPAIQNGDITINVTESSGNYIEFNSTTIDVASDAPDGTLVNLTVTTQSSSDADLVTVTNTTNSIVLRSPDASFNSTGDIEVFVDNEGVTTPGNNQLTNITINATTDDQFGVGENVTVGFSDTAAGVTFNDSAGSFDNYGNVDSVVVADDGTELTFNVTSALTASDQVNITNVSLDVASDASNVTLDVVVPTNDSDVSVGFDGQYTVTKASPSTVNNVSSDSVTQSVGEETEVRFNVTSADLDRQLSSNNQSFAGAQTEVALGSSPDDFGGTLSDIVTDTSLVTDTEGDGKFNFSSDTTGDYTIFVNSTDTDASQSFDFTVSSGNVSSITVEGTENAFRGGADGFNQNTQTGVYKVDVTDSEGNLVTTDQAFEFRVLVSGQTSELIGLSDDLPEDGTGGNTTITPGGPNSGPFYNVSGSANNVFQYNASDDTTDEQGTFYVYVGNDLAEDVDVEIVPRGSFSDVNTATGTATFYSNVDSVSLNADAQLATDQNVTATATAVTSDGTQIAVPRIAGGTVFSSDNTTVLDITNQSDTDAAGEATANLTTGSAGTANLTANLDGVTDSTEVTVENVTSNFTLEFVDGPTTIVQNESFSATLSVTNDGDAAGTQDVTYVLEDSNGDSTEIEATESGVELDAGNSTEVTFEVPASATADLSTGNYTHVFASNDDEVTVDAEVVEESTVPTDPEERALQLTGVNNASELTQDDVTATITRFERNESANGVDPTQDDVTTVITLFERN